MANSHIYFNKEVFVSADLPGSAGVSAASTLPAPARGGGMGGGKRAGRPRSRASLPRLHQRAVTSGCSQQQHEARYASREQDHIHKKGLDHEIGPKLMVDE